ncbi:MAG: ribonuclease P protein component [Xanthomonadales bacterium]
MIVRGFAWAFTGFLRLKNRVQQTKPPRRITFPACARLLKHIEFERVFRNSIVSSDRYFTVLARGNEGACSRLGMVVSRRVDRHAVGRNRIKRVIRESFRQAFETVVSPTTDKSNNGRKAEAHMKGCYPGIDIVVLPRRQAATICNHQLFQSLQAHWSHLKQETE